MFHAEWDLDRLIASAVEERASDVHFESEADGIRVRFRIDGLLRVKEVIPKASANQTLNRIKVLSGMDIGEKRLPQDGRWIWEHGRVRVAMRTSILPSAYGETAVCRMPGNEGHAKSLAELGMDAETAARVEALMHRPHGLFTVCGPTGSGKTATLYAMLRLLNLRETSLVTLEQPIEAEIADAVQVEIRPKTGLTFASGLRAVLRQDPDTIMVGEIRDSETAQLAVQAALTGHRVLSTIHTNSAAGVLERLVDMGVERYLVEAVLNGALSQRLYRTVVPDGGNEDGDATRYAGRRALFELLVMPTEGADFSDPKRYLVRTMRASALEALRDGLTTTEELRRIGMNVECEEGVQ